MRTRNFRVWSEVVERGAVTKSQKGKKRYVERKVGGCFQWKAHGQCSKGDSCSFSHELASGNRCGGQRREEQSSSPAPNSKANPQNNEATEMKTIQTEGAKFRADTQTETIRHVVLGILPCVKTSSLKLDAHLAKNAFSDMLRRRRSPTRSRKKKGGAKEEVATVKGSIQLGCVSQDSYPRKSVPREKGKLCP